MRFDPSPEPLFWLLRRLPERWVRWLARGIGILLYAILGSRRRLIFSNLTLAFPDMPKEEQKRIAKASWSNLVLSCCELIRFPTHLESLLEDFSHEGVENLQRAYDKGKGVLFYGLHMGNWELAGAFTACRFNVSAIVRPMNQSRLEAAIHRIREGTGVNVFVRKNALRGVLAGLRRGDAVAFMLDQHAGKNGVTVTFFGHPISAFSSVAHLALKTGAPVVFAYPYRREDGGVHFTIEEETPLVDTGDAEKDVVTNTQNYTTALENAIRAHPDSWMWMHRRWRDS